MKNNALAANDPALPDRRKLLGSAALAAAVSATAILPARAVEPPSPVEIAFGAWIAAARAHDAACEAVWEIEDGPYEEPERPRYDHWRSWGDHEVEWINPERTKGRSYCKVDDANVAVLEAIIAEPFDPSRSDEHAVEINRFNHDRRREVAKATLAQVRAYRVEAKRRADACGLTAAREQERACEMAAEAARAALLALPTTSFRDAAFLAVLLEVDSDEEVAERLATELRTLAGIPSYYGEA